MAAGAEWIMAEETPFSVISGRGGVREIRDILCEVLAQYGLRTPIADAPGPLLNAPAVVNPLAGPIPFAYRRGSTHGDLAKSEAQTECLCR
jgi:hypothetical protein